MEQKTNDQVKAPKRREKKKDVILVPRIHKNKLNAYNKNVGKNLRSYRKLKGISQLTLSKVLGIDKGIVSLYETGKASIQGKYIYAISEFLGINISLFFESYEKKFKGIKKLKQNKNSNQQGVI